MAREAHVTRFGILPICGRLSFALISGLFLALTVLPYLHAQAAASAPAAAPRQQPSFDCRKATSASEKTICANAALSRLDFQLGRAWERLLLAFDIDPVQQPQMRQDQRTWIARRQECGEDANCIGKLYRDRLST